MIAYVILHYQNIDITKRCVESVLENDCSSTIIIIDNASPNGSGIVLEKSYLSSLNIHVIKNKTNQGFARGNNVGFRYAKQLGANIIVVMNNDVLIEKQFKITLLKLLGEDIDILGPDIRTPDGRHQNPLKITGLSSSQLVKEIVLNCLKIIYLSNKSLFNKYIQRKSNYAVSTNQYSKDYYDCILHGSIIIFGNKYVCNENFAFVPVTFMYGEEFILADYAKRMGYKTAYRKDLHITHLGGASTKLDCDMQSKILFRFKNTTKSLIKQLILRFMPIGLIKKYDTFLQA